MYIDELNHRFSTYSLTKKVSAAPVSKPDILSQKTFRVARTTKKRWLVAALCVPFFGIYTAFGLAPKPDHSVSNLALTKTEIVPLASMLATNTKDDAFTFSDRVKTSDTLGSILERLQINDHEAISFFKSDVLALTNEKSIKPGQTLSATVDHSGHLKSLNFQFDHKQSVLINQTPDNQLIAKKVDLAVETRQVLKSATITHSVFASTDAADVPDSIALQMIKLFESDIDFHREIQKGDQFKVVYEANFHNGKRVSTGSILAVEFINKNHRHAAIGFRDHKGEMHYYSPKGNSLGKTFLRSPLEYTRITSGFNPGRYHPILQRIRAHKGVDMAAPSGTKIRAAGDATVEFSGWKGGYGRVVILKHDQGVKTVYGHLSAFAKHLKKGKVIKQGDIIGYVGKSGMATGPHLHYEFLKHGQHMDPMKVALPKSTHINAAQKAKFLQTSKLMQAKLKLLEHTNIAALR